MAITERNRSSESIEIPPTGHTTLFMDRNSAPVVKDSEGNVRGMGLVPRIRWKEDSPGLTWDTSNVPSTLPSVKAVITSSINPLYGAYTIPYTVKIKDSTISFNIDVNDGDRVLRAVGSVRPTGTVVLQDVVVDPGLYNTTVVIDDGIHSAVTFVFVNDGSVTPSATTRVVQYTNGQSLPSLAILFREAILTSALNMEVIIVLDSHTNLTTLNLTNTEATDTGNINITSDIPSVVVTGMSGGVTEDQIANGLYVVNAAGAWTRSSETSEDLKDCVVEWPLPAMDAAAPYFLSSGVSLSFDSQVGSVVQLSGLVGITPLFVGLGIGIENADNPENTGPFVITSVINSTTVTIDGPGCIVPDINSGNIIYTIILGSETGASLDAFVGTTLTVSGLNNVSSYNVGDVLNLSNSDDDNDGYYIITGVVNATTLQVESFGSTVPDSNNGNISWYVAPTDRSSYRFNLWNPLGNLVQLDVDPQDWRVNTLPLSIPSTLLKPINLAAAFTGATVLAGDVFEFGDGNSVLVTAQPNPADNGIYCINAEGAWKRHPDYDTGAELVGTIVQAPVSFLPSNTYYWALKPLPHTTQSLIVGVSPQYWHTLDLQGQANFGPQRVDPVLGDIVMLRSSLAAVPSNSIGIVTLPRMKAEDGAKTIEVRGLGSATGKDLGFGSTPSITYLQPSTFDSIETNNVGEAILIITLIGNGYKLQADGVGRWNIIDSAFSFIVPITRQVHITSQYYIGESLLLSSEYNGNLIIDYPVG